MSAPDHWTLTPDLVMLDPTLSAETRLVFYAFLSYADRDGWCHPKQVTLAARLGMTQQNVSYHLGKLRDRHLLETQKKGKLNHSRVLAPTAPPSIEYIYRVDTSDPTYKPGRSDYPARTNGIDASDPERIDGIDTNVSIPSIAERSHVERKTEYVPELDLHKSPEAPGPLLRAGGAPAPPEKTISPEFINALVDEYAAQLGGPAAVRKLIHFALLKRDPSRMVNPRQYLRRALEGAVHAPH